MSHIEASFTIRGSDFDSASFSKSLPSGLKGEVKPLKNWREGMPLLQKHYWKSERTTLSISDETELLSNLINDYKIYFETLNAKEATSITCNLVVHFDDENDVHGFWFSPEIIGSLSQLGIGLDMDLYCYPVLENNAMG